MASRVTGSAARWTANCKVGGVLLLDGKATQKLQWQPMPTRGLNRSNFVCDWCFASKTLSYLNYACGRPIAPWRGTECVDTEASMSPWQTFRLQQATNSVGLRLGVLACNDLLAASSFLAQVCIYATWGSCATRLLRALWTS